jgi:hypothetical protein
MHPGGNAGFMSTLRPKDATVDQALELRRHHT